MRERNRPGFFRGKRERDGLGDVLIRSVWSTSDRINGMRRLIKGRFARPCGGSGIMEREGTGVRRAEGYL